MSDSVRPHRWQPIRLPHPWDSPGKNTGVGCHFLLQCMKVKVKVKSLSRVWASATPLTAAYQAPPSMGFSRQESWTGVPLPSLYIHTHKYKIAQYVFQNLEKSNSLQQTGTGTSCFKQRLTDKRYLDADCTNVCKTAEIRVVQFTACRHERGLLWKLSW